jgi:hypothetical protein
MAYRNHHHVPEFLLKNFAGDHGLYHFHKDYPQKGVRVRNPKKIFSIPHLYSFSDEKGVLRKDIESSYLKSIDNDAAEVVMKIIEKARLNVAPHLTHKELEHWSDFFLAQFKRSLDRMQSTEVRRSSEELFDDSIDRLRKHVKDNPARLEELHQTIMNHDRIVDRGVKESVSVYLPETKALMMERNIMVVRIAGSKSLIIGSSPLVRFGNRGSNRLDDFQTELWFPISHDVAVAPGYGSLRNGELRFLNDDDSNIIRSMNRIILRNSREIAGRSETLLRSLIGKLDQLPSSGPKTLKTPN